MPSPVRPQFDTPQNQTPTATGAFALTDDSTVQVRLTTPEDREALRRLFRELAVESPDSRLRSTAMPGPALIARIASENDPHFAIALVVTIPSESDNPLAAIGTYLARDAKTAEVALAVLGTYRGAIAPFLLKRLALLASQNGFTRFYVLTSVENAPLLDVFREARFQVRDHPAEGGVEFEISSALTGS